MGAPEPFVNSPGYQPEAIHKEQISMSKKFLMGLAPLLAVAAFAIVPAAAQAEFHWYKCEHFAAETHNRKDVGCTEATATGNYELKRTPFEAGGKLTIIQIVTWGRLRLIASNGIVIVCKVIDWGNVWNVLLANPGHANVEGLVAY